MKDKGWAIKEGDIVDLVLHPEAMLENVTVLMVGDEGPPWVFYYNGKDGHEDMVVYVRNYLAIHKKLPSDEVQN